MSTKISIEIEKEERPKYLKALRFRIYPTEEQKQFLLKSFGISRKIYNEHLQERNEFYLNNICGKKLSEFEKLRVYQSFKARKCSDFKKEFPYTKEVSDWVLQFAIRNCDIAFKNFFNSLKKNKKVGKKKNPYGFPQFKSKKDNHQTFQVLNVDKKRHFDFNEKTVRIPKLGKIKFFERKLPKWWKIVEKFGTVTIEKTSAEKYYISILCYLKKDWKEETPKNREEGIGLDFSPAELYVDSNNKTGKDFGYKPQKQISHKKLRRLQRIENRRKRFETENSPRKQNSKNREKARIKLAQYEAKIANRRKTFQEIETKRLVTKYSKVVVEDLNLKGISKFLTNAKNMNDTSWGSFVTKLEEKGKKYSCQVIKADRYFPSSQLCSNCGYQYHELKLSERKWACPKCGTFHFRDHNAAINLKNYQIPTQHRKFTTTETERSLKGLALKALTSKTVEEVVTENREISDTNPKSL